ncbi:3-demethylubiquinone-9 3-methyltransferase [Fusobacterium animalis ATCC 51191]|uniref:3-demethylubiquinone-9 3-methyltransferase n=1 Tax=Fusobacterium animalis ATCC 51191 TaxID=997347 RepID=F9EP37_9FUSO|nr:3-demethylubiquinone-9 3-methyltransferase [Fusobacterium animalis ATCC 51191]
MYGNIEPKSEINNFVETEKEVFYYLESFSYLENIFFSNTFNRNFKF